MSTSTETVTAERLAALAPFPCSQALLADLAAGYAQPPRAYHSFEHVREVAEHFASLPVAVWRQPKEVFAAILFHDVVYIAGRKDNEVLSAQRFLSAQDAELGRLDRKRVMQLIELTAAHGKLSPGDVDADAALFLDCDMAIVAAPKARFELYEQQIRSEYSAVAPGPLYGIGRKRFLRGLLDKPRIFLSDHFHRLLDQAARDNLRRALG